MFDMMNWVWPILGLGIQLIAFLLVLTKMQPGKPKLYALIGFGIHLCQELLNFIYPLMASFDLYSMMNSPEIVFMLLSAAFYGLHAVALSFIVAALLTRAATPLNDENFLPTETEPNPYQRSSL